MSVPQSPTSTTSSTKLRRDTGFPEPFCGSRNTTRHHPDADISPNASISAEDIDPNRTIRRSLRARTGRYRHTLAHGKITTTSSESLHPSTTSSTGGADDELLEEMHVVIMPDGRVSNDMSLEDARASFAAEREEEEEELRKRGMEEEPRKRGIIKRILRQ